MPKDFVTFWKKKKTVNLTTDPYLKKINDCDFSCKSLETILIII